MDIFCTLTVRGPDGPTRRLADEMYLDDNLWPPFGLNHLVPRGSLGPTEAWGSPCGAIRVRCTDTTARPLVLQFESRQEEPGELIRSLSEQHPELVFALEFFAEHYWFFGWTVFVAGKVCDGFVSSDPHLFDGLLADHAFRERELEHPEVALIDSIEATEWGSRYMAASRAICRRSANAVGLADEVREMESHARHVGEVDLDIEVAIPAIRRSVISLDEFAQKASFHQAKVACRMAVQRALEALAATPTEAL
jgi:hypothetical protein